MKWIKNIAALLLLIFTFLFSYAGEKGSDRSIQKAAKNSIDKVDYLKTTAFVKPHIGSNISAENRDHSPLTAKWFVSYIDLKFTHFTAFTEYASFLRQDINRCSNVSILLFPHHIFW